MSGRRYAIIGSGALGGLYGGMLAQAGFEVHFLFHSDHQHVRDHGLRVESVLGDFHLHDVHVHDSADTLPACDVTLLGLKTTNNHLLASLLPRPTRDGGVVLCLQNGLDVEQASAAVVGAGRVLGGCCFLCSNKVGPGHIRHLDQGRIVLGDWRESSGGSGTVRAGKVPISTIAAGIADDMTTSGIDARTTDDLLLTRWRKLMWNIPFNGLSVVLGATTKELIEDENSVSLARALIEEVHQAAAACRVPIPPEMIDKTIDVTRSMVPYDSSMRLDHLAGRPMEIDAIFDAPILRAAQAGFPMPRVEVLRQQLRFIGKHQRGND